jgi:pyruvate dehydrogenase E1 component alpha subunit
MRTIRAFELKLAELVTAGKMGGFMHLYAGEEAVAVGVCQQLREGDFVASTHRGHGHCIAKGVDVAAMMAELFGRATGCCRARAALHSAWTAACSARTASSAPASPSPRARPSRPG